jgi:hypothetical protein
MQAAAQTAVAVMVRGKPVPIHAPMYAGRRGTARLIPNIGA